MAWTKLGFGKYEGLTLPQVMFRDPDWFFWAYNQDKLSINASLKRESNDIHYKASNVWIPQDEGGNLVAEYVGYAPDGSFVRLQLVPATEREHRGSSPTHRTSKIDFGIPFAMKRYDKAGYKGFLRKVKYILFGDANYRMTKARCEEFFDDADNFVLD